MEKATPCRHVFVSRRSLQKIYISQNNSKRDSLPSPFIAVYTCHFPFELQGLPGGISPYKPTGALPEKKMHVERGGEVAGYHYGESLMINYVSSEYSTIHGHHQPPSRLTGLISPSADSRHFPLLWQLLLCCLL